MILIPINVQGCHWALMVREQNLKINVIVTMPLWLGYNSRNTEDDLL